MRVDSGKFNHYIQPGIHIKIELARCNDDVQFQFFQITIQEKKLKARILKGLAICLSSSAIAAAYGGTLHGAAGAAATQAGARQLAAADTCSAWNATAIYTAGQCATYQGSTYTAKWWTQGNVPGTDQW